MSWSVSREVDYNKQLETFGPSASPIKGDKQMADDLRYELNQFFIDIKNDKRYILSDLADDDLHVKDYVQFKKILDTWTDFIQIVSDQQNRYGDHIRITRKFTETATERVSVNSSFGNTFVENKIIKNKIGIIQDAYNSVARLANKQIQSYPAINLSLLWLQMQQNQNNT